MAFEAAMTVQLSQVVCRAMRHPGFDACPHLHRLVLIGVEESYGKPTSKLFPSHRMMPLKTMENILLDYFTWFIQLWRKPSVNT